MIEKTINLHLTDRCNFKCKHCFVNMKGRELSLQECISIIDAVYDMNQFTRINLAGGEPMMVRHLQDVIDYVVKKGFKCSIITNGSLLTTDFIKRNRNKLCMIGISIDSLDDEVNKLIGRKSILEVKKLCECIKKEKIRLKINICISKYNLSCDFTHFLEEIEPDRLKLLQILPTPQLGNSSELLISKEEFKVVCKKLISFNPICEENEYMREAYLIVDSEGCLCKDNLHLNNSEKIKLI